MTLKRLLLIFAAASLTLFAAGCGSSDGDPDPDPDPDPEEIFVTQRIGAAGGSLILENPDGSTFELRIPAAALSGEQDITIRRIPAAEWPNEAQENPPIGGSVFELLPEGTTFEVPVTTITRFSQAPAGLGNRTNQTLPSHASRSGAGTMQRHPTTVSSRSDGSAVLIGRTSHFSTHWLSTKTDDGEFGVNLSWPEGPFGAEEYIEATEFSVWTSSEASPVLSVSLGLFAPAPVPPEEVPVLYPGSVGEYAAGTEIEAELRSYLDGLGDEREIDETSSSMFTREIEYPVGAPFDFDWMVEYPYFVCYMDDVGSAWVVVQTFIPDGAGGTVPLTYVDEVTFDCSSLPG
jgi:hypothetical protein